MDQAPPRSTVPTHLCYNQYLCSYSQGDFNIQQRQTPSVLVLQFYHPVWVFVKCYPEVILTILRCKEHIVAYVLLDDTLPVVTHKVGKAILCLTRDWCDGCGVHESRCVLYVSNLVDDVGLVEIVCATCATVTSRRDCRIESRRGFYFLIGEE